MFCWQFLKRWQMKVCSINLNIKHASLYFRSISHTKLIKKHEKNQMSTISHLPGYLVLLDTHLSLQNHLLFLRSFQHLSKDNGCSHCIGHFSIFVLCPWIVHVGIAVLHLNNNRERKMNKKKKIDP